MKIEKNDLNQNEMKVVGIHKQNQIFIRVIRCENSKINIKIDKLYNMGYLPH